MPIYASSLNGQNMPEAGADRRLTVNGAVVWGAERIQVFVIDKAGVYAGTLANPTVAESGKILLIVSQTANAHTITAAGGFNAGGAATDVGTFGAAAGNALGVIACGGFWWTIANIAVVIA